MSFDKQKELLDALKKKSEKEEEKERKFSFLEESEEKDNIKKFRNRVEENKNLPPFVKTKLIRGFDLIREIFPEIKNRGGMILGGYARYCASPLRNPVMPGDLDIYCQNQEVFDKIKLFLEDNDFKKQFESDNAITYIPNSTKYNYLPDVQLIKALKSGRLVSQGSDEEILSNFDFTITRAAIIDSETILVDKDFIEDETNKKIQIKNIHCPVGSVFRINKYSNKGYLIFPSQVVKLFIDWEGRDQNYRDKLHDFLTDVESGKELSKEEIDQLELLLGGVD
mgnify:CR=1 FL=1